MQELQIRFTQGHMQGESMSFALGTLIIGREPRAEAGQETLVLTGADGAVSRNHAQLLDQGGEIVLRNISGNGTRVNGTLVMEEAILKPGATISIGSHHSFTADWQQVGQRGQPQAKGSARENATKVASSGLLGSPVVRALLVVYLGAIIAVAGYLSWRGDRNEDIRDDWPELSQAYAQYQPEGLEEEEKARRAKMAEAMLVRLRVLRANDRDRGVKHLCRELMRLDADIQSPIYLYGAKCLGSID